MRKTKVAQYTSRRITKSFLLLYGETFRCRQSTSRHSICIFLAELHLYRGRSLATAGTPAMAPFVQPSTGIRRRPNAGRGA